MKKVILAVAAVLAISGCTTTERDVATGAGVGAVAGAIVGGGRGAVIGTAVGAASGLLVRNLRNGYCEYRNSRGQLYTARCR
ncbi:YMGG-like glycine zipper-containing protein [Mesorhizobium sp. ANAO-SY3R2]|uniref:YMGG-like glycine zipper-containing protein n=1 Tax=Mesorhizobium sp. ANAO-SY3R2 TaxID=3166644 RepID=UPI00366F3B08